MPENNTQKYILHALSCYLWVLSEFLLGPTEHLTISVPLIPPIDISELHTNWEAPNFQNVQSGS